MHRTYSMRQSRAPTQSQIEKPPPPPSSTKVGRLFGASNFGGNTGHNLRKSMAGAYGPDLARKLSQLVKMEKNVMRSMELVGRERREVARQLSIWGEECDEDVSDITDKLGVLIFEIGELEDQFIDRYDQYRVTIKSIRNIEASVQPSRDRKQKITDQIAQLKYKDPNSPKIVVLEQELVRAEAESLVAEAQLSNITREKIKSAFTYQFDAMREHAEKVAMIAGYGKHLLDLIDDTPVTPGETREAYDGYEDSKNIIQDCEDALTNWTESRAVIRPRLSVRGSRPRRTHGRASRTRQPISLSDQDRPLHDDHHGWVPAEEHERKSGRNHNHVALNRDDDEYEDISDDEPSGGSRRHSAGGSRRSVEDERGSLRNGHPVESSRGRRSQELVTED
ncbi:Eisosome component PIL1-domain-containing protein [Pyronema domesticum]|nr:Eisosome component PIL1-domain-containing protein [Pyronema domesticum]